MAAALTLQAKQLGAISERLADDTKHTPEVLIKPIAEKVNSVHEDIYGMIEQLMQSDAKPSRGDLDRVAKREAVVTEVLAQLEADLGKSPWQNPPALRQLRRTLDTLTSEVADLGKMRGEIYSPKQARKDAGSRGVTPNMGAGDKRGGAPDKPMSVEDALQMLLEKKGPQWQGGLVGIVHAAGVQEMTPISSHSPGKFEFIFAPKSQAAWNLHTFGTMV
eukprot:CAMPEP_0179122492 /NCGR_PEP_ID=MMETSP0796-20121207/57813_1 /TAXON_ID=73915 /ORGANISM="Pyrodinium bahamense, Strain pbaha01" /LENGTH=218 /DNA_ID=CAMNT_0020821115 /DNA_START=41 /DNA_END=697 /DNA_ORIENTATION=+